MNKLQIISFVLIAFSIFTYLNMKFDIHRYLGASSDEAIELIYESKATKNDSSGTNKSSIMTPTAKMFFIASVVMGFIAFLLLLISLNILNGWFEKYNLAKDSLEWTPVEATVTEKGRQGSSNRNHSVAPSLVFSDAVYYSFVYNGEEKKGQRLSYDNGWATSNPSSEGGLLTSVPDVGEMVTIYFDEKSGKSVMFPGRVYTNYWALILIMPFYLVGIFISFFALSVAIIGFALRS